MMTAEVARWSVAQSLAIDVHTAEVVSALHAADVPVVLLKGPSIARWLYTDGTPRPYGDTDLLVPDERFSDAERVLESLGLVHQPMRLHVLEPRRHASNWVSGDGLRVVDLHWTLPRVGARELAWSVVVRDAVPLVVAGCELLIESEPMRAFHVALHAAQDGPHGAKPQEDLRRALRVVHGDTWIQARALAEELDAVAAMALGLGLVPEGADLAERLSLDATGATPEVLLRAEGASAEELVWARVLAQPTWRRRARVARAIAFPPISHVRASDAMAGIANGTVVGAYWRRLRRGASGWRVVARVRRSARGRSGRG